MLKEEIADVVQRVDPKELRKFGLTVGLVIGILAAFLFWKLKPSAIYFSSISGILILSGLLFPKLLKPIYIGWMSFATVLGFVMTRVIMTLLYVFVFTPVGIVIRLFGKDPLNQKLDHQAKSYWKNRDRKSFDPKSVENQF